MIGVIGQNGIKVKNMNTRQRYKKYMSTNRVKVKRIVKDMANIHKMCGYVDDLLGYNVLRNGLLYEVKQFNKMFNLNISPDTYLDMFTFN